MGYPSTETYRHTEQAMGASAPDVCAARATPPMDEALTFLQDRLDRLEHGLGLLEVNLQPALRRFPDEPGCSPSDGPTPPDSRSALVQVVRGHAFRVDRLADVTFALLDRLEL